MKESSDILSNGLPVEPENESLERIAPLLHSISKENPFSVPENYFDGLPSQIVQRSREEVAGHQWPAIFEKLKFYVLGYKWSVLTMTSCLAVICFFVIPHDNRPVPYETLAKSIPDSLIIEHFDKNITDVNLSALEDISAEYSMGQENATSSVKNPSDSTTTDQDIIAYLMNTNISVSDIENEP